MPPRLRTAPTAVAAALLASLVAAPPIAVHAAGENDGRLRITTPKANATVSDAAAEVRGTVDAASGAGRINVMFAVDVSGSTASPSQMDCNGDGQVDGLDDYNSDGNRGDVLDCEISGVLAVNAQLRALPNSATNVRVGVTAFGSSAAAADMSPVDDSTFVGPGQTGSTDDDVTPWVGQVLTSLTAGYVGAFTEKYVSTGTNFDNAVTTAVAELGKQTGPKYLFFLSDGQASVSSSTLQSLAASGVTARSFAVGTGTAGCDTGAPLAAIASSGSGTCTVVTNPANLTAAISEAPSTVEGVTVDAIGLSPAVVAPVNATIDALGNYSAVLNNLPAGATTLRVQARFTDGTTETDTVSVYAAPDKFTYVALGDSYASGEGIEPYIGQDPESGRATNDDFLCHRSRNGWPRQIRLPWASSTIADQAASSPSTTEFRFKACSGAVTGNADTVQQSKRYRDKARRLMPLQYNHLDPAVDLVTVSMGGNDLDFAGVTTHCASKANCQDDEYLTTAAGKKVTLNDWSRIRLALLSSELEGFYSGIKNRVGSDTKVIATTYPKLMSKDFSTNDLCILIGNSETDWLWKQIDTAAEIIKYRAGRTGVQVADVRDAFNNHLACSGDPYIYSLVATRSTDLEAANGWYFALLSNISAATMHPNGKGANAYAGVVNKVLTTANAQPAPVKVASKATTNEALADDGIDPLIVTDPQAVLAQYPADVVNAVKTSTSLTVALGRGAAGPDSCNPVVANERVPVAADGLEPGTPAVVTTEILDAQGNLVGTPQVNTATVNGEGAVSLDVVLPAAQAASASITVEGTNPAGGTATGTSNVTMTADAQCVAAVTAAGFIGPKSAASAPVPLAKPTIGGKLKVGAKVTATTGTWSGAPDLTYGYKWRVGAKVVAGATQATFKIPAKAAGRKVSVEVTATRKGFAATAARSASMKVAKVKSRVKATVTKASDGRRVVNVRVRAQYGLAVTGRVTVKVDGIKEASVKLKRSARGKWTVKLPRLVPGTHHLRVTYSGSKSVRESRTRHMPPL